MSNYNQNQIASDILSKQHVNIKYFDLTTSIAVFKKKIMGRKISGLKYYK